MYQFVRLRLTSACMYAVSEGDARVSMCEILVSELQYI